MVSPGEVKTKALLAFRQKGAECTSYFQFIGKSSYTMYFMCFTQRFFSHSNHQSLPIARDTLILVLVSLQQIFSEVSNCVLPYVTDFGWTAGRGQRLPTVSDEFREKPLWESVRFNSHSEEQKVSKPILMVTPFIANFCSFSLGQNVSVPVLNLCPMQLSKSTIALRTYIYEYVYIWLMNDRKMIPTDRASHVDYRPIFIQEKLGHR